MQSNFFSLFCRPLRRLLNYLRNIFNNTESTDGKSHFPRSSWRHWTRRLRNFFLPRRQQEYPVSSFPRLALPKFDFKSEYEMNHEKRGLAVIFNHKFFDLHTGYGTRLGTEVDLESLKRTCQALGFQTKYHDDLKRVEIFQELERSE